MKVLLMNGSPNEYSCTYTALREAADTLNHQQIDAEILWIGKKPVAGCIACGKCYETGSCVFHDLVNETAARLDQFDGFIFGSPVYYASASGQLTAFMDRLFYSGGRGLTGKPGAAVVSCRRGGATAAFDQINKYFSISHMPIVTSQYWNQVHGNTPDEVRQDLEGLQTMRSLADNMAWLLKSIDAGKKAGIVPPVREKRISTNFIR